MPTIVSIHSYRGGTGKSSLTANLATLLAKRGYRAGMVDTDMQSPGLHTFFGWDESGTVQTLNDYLLERCPIDSTAYDVGTGLTNGLGELAELAGKVYLVPASSQANEIAYVLKEGYSVELLNEGLQAVIRAAELDYLLIDTHPGLNEETLLSIAISDVLIVILRPDQRDYLGTAVTLEVARRLEVPRTLLVVNELPAAFDQAGVKAQVTAAFGCPVAAVLPHSVEMAALASGGVFVLCYPDHPVTTSLEQVATTLMTASTPTAGTPTAGTLAAA
ncbi:MAG: MinD/ParA family protein [Thermoflexales bacterium]|nr:MinD/ParA family protein [Thermoflexales bacterium]